MVLRPFENGPFQEYLKEELGVDVSDQDFLPFQDIEESVREDMQLLIESPLIPDDVIILVLFTMWIQEV